MSACRALTYVLECGESSSSGSARTRVWPSSWCLPPQGPLQPGLLLDGASGCRSRVCLEQNAGLSPGLGGGSVAGPVRVIWGTPPCPRFHS